MGLLGNLRLAGSLASSSTPPTPADAPRQHSSGVRLPGNPFQTNSFAGSLAWSDLFGEHDLITREQALTIPGVSRARGVLISLVCDVPLVAAKRAPDVVLLTRAPSQPAWLTTSPGWAGPFQRMLLSLDDHIFYGETLWGVTRGEAPAGIRPILNAWHIPYEDWSIDPAGRICVRDEDGQQIPADADEVLYIPAAHDGLLATASRTFRGAVDLERSWISRARNPIPALDLHETEETNLEEDERQEIVDAWAAARTDPNGAIASTPWNIDARVLGTVDAQLFVEGRNAVRLDIANFFQLPAALIDATTATASLTYTTQESAESSVGGMSIPYWARPFEDRLSQDDVVPHGTAVRFAFNLPTPPSSDPESARARAMQPDTETGSE